MRRDTGNNIYLMSTNRVAMIVVVAGVRSLSMVSKVKRESVNHFRAAHAFWGQHAWN